ncbi:unnamed protein product [Oikopleura dioica]|uniref:Uncharacterized protein n=1 Tax=Oikopleura dioica TaxID=34765 RepID=E4Y7U1_OIKDI|nr:unnamed protein product [Oikopleura dioica]
MKLFATVVASAASQGFYDYNLFNSAKPATNYGKFGTVTGGATGGSAGERSGNGRYCHATTDSIAIHRWDVSINGFFSHYNRVECQGEELYCFMEERAHFGQVVGIRAGCAQMMNHPQVRRTRIGSQQTYNNNREAFRKRTFNNSNGAAHSLVLGYGVGGCMAMHVQNNDKLEHAVLDNTFDAEVNANNFFYPSWYQSQCLRSVSRAANTGGWHDLLPFGVSVCRACCVAGTATETDYHEDTGASAPCNFLPYKQPARGTDLNQRPHIPFGYDFDCIDGYAQDMSAVAALSHEYLGVKTKADIAGADDTAFTTALGGVSCTANCPNARQSDQLTDDMRAAAGGITYHDPGADPNKIRHFSCNDVIRNVRSTCSTPVDPVNAPLGPFEACTDAEWYSSGADGICDGNLSGAVECYPSTFDDSTLLIGDVVTVSNAFSFDEHTWAGETASTCDICRNELVPRFDAVRFDSTETNVNLFTDACDSTAKRCDPKPKSVLDMALIPGK